MNESLDIAKLTPHAAPMLLLDGVVKAGEDQFVCDLIVREDGLFDRGGSVPAYLGLEYMAQSIAAFSGYQASLRDEPVKPGFLLGTRRFNTNVSRFPCGEKLTVNISLVVRSVSGMAVFECIILGDGIQQSATLSVYEPADAQDYLEGRHQ